MDAYSLCFYFYLVFDILYQVLHLFVTLGIRSFDNKQLMGYNACCLMNSQNMRIKGTGCS